MNEIFHVIVVIILVLVTDVDGARLISLNDSPHALQLHLNLRDTDGFRKSRLLVDAKIASLISNIRRRGPTSSSYGALLLLSFMLGFDTKIFTQKRSTIRTFPLLETTHFQALVDYTINSLFGAMSTNLISSCAFEQATNFRPQKPSDTDPATRDAQFRAHICNDFGESRYFYALGWSPVAVEEVYRKRELEKYSGVFNRIFKPTNAHDSDEYTMNSYQLRMFNVVDSEYSYMITEYVFECPLESVNSDDRAPITYYVSKQYDVGRFTKLFMAGRFLFENLEWELPVIYSFLVLAEQPVHAYTNPGFHIELLYLRMRKHVEPADRDDIDPLCKLVSENELDPNNQHNRFCIAISASPYFKNEARHVVGPPCSCTKEKVSFKTSEATEEAVEKSFHERMVPCHYLRYIGDDEEEGIFYFSRAYLSNTIFVYRAEPSTKEIYLENFSFNIGIKDEFHSLAFVEN